MKPLIVGSAGYVGSAVRRELERRCVPIVTLSHQVCRDFDFLLGELRRLRPSILINCAGLTGAPNVDWCENHKGETIMANVTLPLLLVHACVAADIPLAHVSSGCVYNGSAPSRDSWKEADAPNFCWKNPPCSFYSGSKALAEQCLGNFTGVYILRIRMLFDEVDHPKNLITKLLTYERLYDSPQNSMTNLEDAAFAIVQLLELNAPCGTYNIVNPGTMSIRDVVGQIQRVLRPRRTYDKWMARMDTPAPRSDCVLSNRKLVAAGVHLTDIRKRMMDCLDRWKPA